MRQERISHRKTRSRLRLAPLLALVLVETHEPGPLRLARRRPDIGSGIRRHAAASARVNEKKRGRHSRRASTHHSPDPSCHSASARFAHEGRSVPSEEPQGLPAPVRGAKQTARQPGDRRSDLTLCIRHFGRAHARTTGIRPTRKGRRKKPVQPARASDTALFQGIGYMSIDTANLHGPLPRCTWA